jgi:hypothetical protein
VRRLSSTRRQGVRITPNVYITAAGIDGFAAAVEKVIRDRLPAA